MSFFNRHIRLLLISCLAGFYGSAALAQEEVNNPDPLESINRKIFLFNDTFDKYLGKPVAEGYQTVAPDFVEDGVSNFFHNLWGINRIVNNALQGELSNAGKETGRFLINTTVGLLGTIDVASKLGIGEYHEDFGLTLAKWGFSSGPYIVLPLLGPSSVRDGVGLVGSFQLDPVGNLDHVPTRNQFVVGRGISDRADLLETEKLISGDKYIFIRDAYLQHREFLSNDGVVKDNFGEEDFDE
jgi:phospholipid-binding lipoprotein MlaA